MYSFNVHIVNILSKHLMYLEYFVQAHQTEIDRR